MKLSRALTLTFMPLVMTAAVEAQVPTKFENLQFLPKDIARDSLTNIMRSFSFALGVRCQYCHSGGDGVSFEGVSFPSDDKSTKRKARYMLKDGAPAAVAQYKQLRENIMPLGRYDFGEWSINELARKLLAAGDTASTIAMLEMNGEY